MMIPEFRAWHDNKMWYLALLDLWGDPDQAKCDLAPYSPKCEERYNVYLADVVLMQSTGLKDKNGVEIFEGDIFEEGYGKYVVAWQASYARFALKSVHEFEDAFYLGMSNVGEMDLVGNIYENPELLEVSE